MEEPYLLSMQVDSYTKLLQKGVSIKERASQGLEAAFQSVFPIHSFNGAADLEYVHYILDEPTFDVAECMQRGVTYAAPMRVLMRLVVYDKEAPKGAVVVKEIKEQEVFMGEMPLMTNTGNFVINGTERVVVSQLHRSPGVIYDHDKGKTHSSGKILFNARVIPYRGSWLDFEFDHKDMIYARIDRRRKFPVTCLLRALGLGNEEMLDIFFDTTKFRFGRNKITFDFDPETVRGDSFPFDITAGKQVIVPAEKRVTARFVKKLKEAKVTSVDVPPDFLVEKIIAKDVVDPETGELVAAANDILTIEHIEKFIECGIKSIDTLLVNELDRGKFISDTIALDATTNALEAQIDIYRMMRPGEPPTKDSAEALFQNLFFEEARYDLSVVGRMKLNRRPKRRLSFIRPTTDRS